MSFIIRSAVPPPDPVAASPEDCAAEEEYRIAERVAEGIARLRATAEAEGRVQGAAEARAAIAPILARQEQDRESALTALRQVTDQLTAPLARLEDDLAKLVTELALSLTQHILGVAVRMNIDSITALVTTLLAEAVAERRAGQTVILHLHPEDHRALAAQFSAPGLEILVQDTILRGGALVELRGTDGDPIDRLEWDARLDTRLAALRAAMMPADQTA
ncbi:FliH/SctL family protein [Acidisoma silvae]|uniref:Flagellar assembly protein FliH n=1 Tax=Acidisoma silvae TaxID=2802396 RepID=A0A964DYC5_9PROT|nr:FliH/SctL family protein [Acidisoma silvae]MCB8874922.1 hypothetical protein [Acidisoma silvae]